MYLVSISTANLQLLELLTINNKSKSSFNKTNTKLILIQYSTFI